MESSGMGEKRYDAGLGSILGALVGDACGAYLEFLDHPPSADEVEKALQFPGGGTWKLAPGQVTDDGELALCQARGLAESSAFSIEAIARFYAEWIESPPFDIGNTTRSSLGSIETPDGREKAAREGFAPVMTAAARTACMNSKSNGCLMRTSALGVWGWKRDSEVLRQAVFQDCGLTNPNETCLHAAAVYVQTIAALVRGDSKESSYQAVKEWCGKNGSAEVREWLNLAEGNEPLVAVPQIGFMKHAFIAAFRFLLRGTAYPEAIKQTISLGGDTDTNACIVGGLVGAAVGAKGIPEAWREVVLQADHRKGTKVRPEFLHPRDLPKLIYPILG